MADPVQYRPAAVAPKGASQAMAQMELAIPVRPEIPENGVTPPDARLARANRLSYSAIANPPAVPWRARHDRLAIRDFARTNPVLDLGVKLEEPTMETPAQPIELSFTAAPSRTEASLWVQPQQEFATGRVQTGDLATLDLATTGFEISAAAGLIGPAATAAAEAASLQESIPSPSSALPPSAEAVEPVATAALAEPVWSTPPAEPVTPAAPAKSGARGPELITQPIPVVVQGVPAGKAKPVQIFTSILTTDAAGRIPHYESLPLRAKMVLDRAGAPSPKTAPAKTDPVKTDSGKIEPTKTEPAKIESAGSGAKTASVKIPVSAPPQPALDVKPAPAPIRRAPTPPAARLTAPSAKVGENDLGLPQLDLNKVKGPASLWVKIAAAAACALPLTGGIWLYAIHNRGSEPEVGAISSLAAGAGPEWIENFSPNAQRPRTISILRASSGLSDYTMEFSGSVDVKALGWVFRAKDPANFYVGRIEQEKRLGGAAAAFVYFPVIGGVPQARKRSLVALPATPGTVYRIRFEASGERFTAWVQDRKVEEWTDGRLLSGGAGLYSESGERALLQGGFRVIPQTAASK